jgi:hypothetical protein
VNGIEPMMKTLLMICAVATPQPDCSMATADAVIQGHDAASPVQCGLYGQAYIAPGAIAAYLDGKHYLKITCTPEQQFAAPPVQPVRRATRPPDIVQATE